MKSNVMFKVLLLITSITSEALCSRDGTPTVVIVGAGIGGTSCAYYLHKVIGNVNTIILEADSRIGGRLYDVVIDDDIYNIGAYAWTGYQRYIKELAQEMELETTDDDDEGIREFVLPFTFTSWDGNNLVDTEKLGKMHNSSMEFLEADAMDFAERMVENYDERGDKTFISMKEYLTPGCLMEWPTLESTQYYTDAGVDLELQDLAMAPTHILYHLQGMQSQVFSMQISLTVKMDSGRVAGGMQKLPEALLEASLADFHLNSSVKSVTKLSTGFDVTYQSDNGQNTTICADFVVIAAPIEKTGIDFIGFESVIEQRDRKWQSGYVYILTAEGANPEYFKTNDSWNEPNVIAATPYLANTDGFAYYTLSKVTPETRHYSVVALFDITNKLEEIFINPTIKLMHVWEYAHPLLPPHTKEGDSYQEVILAPGLYNVGVMNDIMSQMEGSVIAARNTALLISENLNQVASHCPSVLHCVSTDKLTMLTFSLTSLAVCKLMLI